MESLALVLTDIVLIIVALGGGVLTLVRARRVGGFAVGLAATACGLLVLAAVIDMVWWLAIFPGVLDDREISDAAALNGIASLSSWFMTVVAIGLLFASTNVGRSAAADPAGARTAGPIGGHGAAPAAPGGFAMPAAAPPNGTVGGAPAAQPVAQPAQGWTPPQQQPGQPDWNIHSGVWSIPRGTFDGPPPDQRQH